jgi:putative protein-disulfide isomerase
MKYNLLYLMDPLCAWCHTFSPKVERLMAESPYDLELEILPWGMFPSPRTVDENFGQWLEREVRKIQEQSDVIFGDSYYELLKTGHLVLDSSIPSRAILSVQYLWPQRTLEFVCEIERAFFIRGENPNDETFYLNIVSYLGLPKQIFLDDFQSERVVETQTESFKQSKLISKDFPTLFFRNSERLVALGDKFSNFDKLRSECEKQIRLTE